ncbi:MAG: PP2C family protein-serine/threonine phosphatase [Alphaproteobacteria bacterium]|nr:PP2C family protein-serine/threonine phosphatase [Alphaproteobacteria bacterium]
MKRTDALAEAAEILRAPSETTKRRILLAVNLILGGLFAAWIAYNLATAGRLPDPGRDNWLMPLMVLINLASAAYNGAVLSHRREATEQLDTLWRVASLLILYVLCLSVVHQNPNTATSLLVDQFLSVISIFLTGLLLGRWAALGWFGVTLLSLYVAVQNLGSDFVYTLMTSAEVAALQQSGEAALNARTQQALDEHLLPLPVSLYAVVSGLFATITLAATWFEAGLLRGLVDKLPVALTKIEEGAVEQARLEEENTRLSAELDVAQRIQAMVLPNEDELAAVPGMEIAARMVPATEVGGDLYDVLVQPDGSVCLVIGDVTDHGLRSGVVMLMAQSAVRSALEESGVDLARTLVRANSILYQNVQVRMRDAMSRNLTLSLLHYRDGRLRVAGYHESVIVVRRQGAPEFVKTSGLGTWVGLMDDIDGLLGVEELSLDPGDLVVLYTDGATEAMNPAGEEFGPARIADIVAELRDQPAQAIVDALFQRIHDWMAGAALEDDISLLVARCAKEPPP